MNTESLAQEFIASQPHSPYQRSMGYLASVIRPGYAELKLTVDDRHLNRSKLVHGGVLMALLDSVGGYCGVITADATKPRRAVSLSISTNFVKSARVGSTLTATATVTGGGRQIFFTRMEIFDENNQRIATAEGSYRYIRQEDAQ